MKLLSCVPFYATCTACGKEHKLADYHAQYLLSELPNLPAEQQFACYKICDCGMLVYRNLEGLFSFISPMAKLKSPQYQEILREPNETLRKLKANEFWFDTKTSVYGWLQYARCFYDAGDIEKEQECLYKAIRMMEENPPKVHMQVSPGLLANVSTGWYQFRNEDILVDLYRRTRQWDKAMTMIREERNKTVDFQQARMDVLNYQETLIAEHIDEPK